MHFNSNGLLMKSFELKGQWWIPGFESDCVSGSIKFNPNEGAELDLVGSLSGKEGRSRNPVIINGHADGKAFTLYSCLCIHNSSHSSEELPIMRYERYYAHVVLIGHCFESEEDIKFDELCVSFYNLENWTSITGIKHDVHSNESYPKMVFSGGYVDPDELSVQVRDFKIYLGHVVTNGGCGLRKFSIEQDSYFRATAEETIHFKEFRKNLIFPLQNYLSLGLNEPTFPRKIEGIRKDIKLPGREIPMGIEIYFGFSGATEAEKDIHCMDMLFSLNTISDMFHESLINWFEKIEIMRPVYNLYFASVYNSRVYLDYQFLTYTQALESLHRRVFGGKYMEDDQYKSVYEILTKNIPKSLSESHHDSLKSRIRYGNEFSLRKRMNDFFERYSSLPSIILGSPPKFISQMVDTRNYLTHYTKELEARADKDDKLYFLTMKLKFILQFLFLINAGFVEERAKEIIVKSQEFRRLY